LEKSVILDITITNRSGPAARRLIAVLEIPLNESYCDCGQLLKSLRYTRPWA